MIRALLVVCLLAGHARAEEVLKPIARDRWYRGPHGTNRLLHLSITTVGFVVYPVFNYVEDGVDCRWCGGPNEIDRSVRNTLVLDVDSRGTAARMSDITSYVLSPAVDMGLVLAGTLASPSTAALMDDLIPIGESMVVTLWVTRALKVSFGRTRPYAHFSGPIGDEDNVSFPSGHTSRAFALATSAGYIAHVRGYKVEPYVWASGMTLAVTTAYLRIGADKHYLTDVLAGAAIGVSAGLTVPLLMRRTNATVVPTTSGIAVAGRW